MIAVESENVNQLMFKLKELRTENATLRLGWQTECDLRIEQVDNIRLQALAYKAEAEATKAVLEALKAAVGTVCEGWTLPEGARKVLETVLYKSV